MLFLNFVFSQNILPKLTTMPVELVFQQQEHCCRKRQFYDSHRQFTMVTVTKALI